MPSDPGTLTALLSEWSGGDSKAFRRLVTLAYDDLRIIAHRRLGGGGGDDIATTALVHEAYLRLVDREGGTWESRVHFFAFASRAMRHILVDHARRSDAVRRGGGYVQVDLEEQAIAAAGDARDLLGIDEALTRLADHNPRMAQVVELRFFGGLTVEEVATSLRISSRTVEREWSRARAYLLEALSHGGG